MKITLDDGMVEIFNQIDVPKLIKEKSETAFLEGRAEDAFYLCDLGDVLNKHKLWQQRMPRVEPFYALKCNPDKHIVKLLSSLQIGFDCASRGEIAQVLGVGVPPERIIYANPCKQASHIQYADSNNVKVMTFDSAAELRKIVVHSPSARLILRIFVGATKALCPLGLKFGAHLTEVPELLVLAQSLGLCIFGVSFHVGSGCFDETAYRVAIGQAYQVFQMSRSMGVELSLLDIGGGFPGNLGTESDILFFNDVCDTINASLDEFFPVKSGVRIIAEPGRYYVSSAFHLAVTVVSARETRSESSESCFHYYINEGVYGSFNCTIFDHYIGDHYLLADLDGPSDPVTFKSTFWGPSCDSADKVLDDFRIRKISVGERLVFKNMGAYTIAAASHFNGFLLPYIQYCSTLSDWEALYPLLSGEFVIQETGLHSDMPHSDTQAEDLPRLKSPLN